MKRRGFVLTVVLILAVAMFAGNLDFNNDQSFLTGYGGVNPPIHLTTKSGGISYDINENNQGFSNDGSTEWMNGCISWCLYSPIL